MEVTWADSLTAWSELATAVITGLLLAAAVGAWKAASRQVGAVEQQVEGQAAAHRDQLAAIERGQRLGLRPVVTPLDAQLRPNGHGRVYFQNIGAGPALRVFAEMWCTPAGQEGPATIGDARKLLEARSLAVPPDDHFLVPALGANQTTYQPFGVPAVLERSSGNLGVLGYGLYRITYLDLFDTEFVGANEETQLIAINGVLAL